jgi:AcrR family transcriptional regulator
MTIEGVAARAGVNKTTVYRKWETKAELIRAALISVGDMFKPSATSGDVRTDLLRVAHASRDFTRSYEGQCLMRVRVLKNPEPDLAQIAKDMHDRYSREYKALFKAAIKRGELDAELDIVLWLDMMWGAIHSRVMRREPVSDTMLERLVDAMLNGALPRTEQKSRSNAVRSKAQTR